MQDRNKYHSRSGLGRLINTAWNLAFADGIALLSIAAFVILLGRMYGPEALGRFSFAIALSSMAQTITDAGFDITLPRAVSKHPSSALFQTSAALRVKLMLSLVTIPIAVGAASFKDVSTIIVTVIMALDVIPTTLSYALVSSLRGLNRGSEAARINAMYNILPVALCGGLLFLHVPLYVFALLMLAGDVMKYVHLERMFNLYAQCHLVLREIVTNRESLFTKELFQSAWKEQRAVTMTNLFSAALVRMPTVMLGWFSTDVVLGVYAAASRFFSALRIVPGALLNTIIPQYARRDDSAPRIRFVLLLSLCIAASLACTLYWGAEWLMMLTFKFEESITILRILSFAFAALFLKTTLEAFLLAAHREHVVNLVLGGVTICAVCAYAVVAASTPSSIAYVVLAAESLLCFIFLIVFVVMKSGHSQQNVTESQ